MLLDQIKAQMKAAMKAGKTVEKEILRTAIGEISTEAARTDDGTLPDPKVEKILRKLLKSNRDTIENTADDAQKATLEEEIAVLEALLPKSLTVDEITAALAPVTDAIKAAGNDGQATGVAMKHLKGQGAVVEGKDVSAAVKQIRA
jgi:uncharacterized protein